MLDNNQNQKKNYSLLFTRFVRPDIIITIIILAFISLGILSFLGLTNKQPKQPIYDPVDAGKVTYANLPEDVKNRLTNQDIDLILELEFQYQQKIGLVSDSISSGSTEPVVMDEKVIEFIINEAKKSQRKYSSDDVDKVLKAEVFYLKQIGVVKD